MILRPNIIFVIAASIASAACDSNDQQRLREFQQRLEQAAHLLNPGATVRAQMMSLQDGERLVVINSNYGGSIETSDFIGPDLAKDITRYGREEGPTWILLVRNQQVTAKSTLSPYNIETSRGPVMNNAKVALPQHTHAVLTCRLRQNLPADKMVWNKNCVAELTGFN